MTDKELKRLSRADILELLINQLRENRRLLDELEAAQKELDEFKICSESAGSLAEAASKINGVFNSAQKTADKYSDEAIKRSEEKCALMEEECIKECRGLMKDTKRRCIKFEEKTRLRCLQIQSDYGK